MYIASACPACGLSDPLWASLFPGVGSKSKAVLSA